MQLVGLVYSGMGMCGPRTLTDAEPGINADINALRC